MFGDTRRRRAIQIQKLCSHSVIEFSGDFASDYICQSFDAPAAHAAARKLRLRRTWRSGARGDMHMVLRHLRTGIMSVVLSLLLAGGLGTDLASADPEDDHQTDVEHAEQDLVGVSITDIERQTRANAARIKTATGVAPGGRSSNQIIPNASLS